MLLSNKELVCPQVSSLGKIIHKNQNQEHKAYNVVDEALFLRELEINQASLVLGLNFTP